MPTLVTSEDVIARAGLANLGVLRSPGSERSQDTRPPATDRRPALVHVITTRGFGSGGGLLPERVFALLAFTDQDPAPRRFIARERQVGSPAEPEMVRRPSKTQLRTQDLLDLVVRWPVAFRLPDPDEPGAGVGRRYPRCPPGPVVLPRNGSRLFEIQDSAGVRNPQTQQTTLEDVRRTSMNVDPYRLRPDANAHAPPPRDVPCVTAPARMR